MQRRIRAKALGLLRKPYGVLGSVRTAAGNDGSLAFGDFEAKLY
jgi:hypothetical protein